MGTDYSADRGIVDVSIYGNNGGTITAKANKLTNIPTIYRKDRDVYIKFNAGMSIKGLVVGNAYMEDVSALPSGTEVVSVTTY